MSFDSTNTPSPIITVFGSINIDIVIRCSSLPLPGQTISGSSANEVCGGKGANQAVAAAKAGGDVRMIGRIGNDAFSSRLVSNLRTHNINCECIQQTENTPSGLAVVAVEDSGQNSILLVAGANGVVSVDDAVIHRQVIETADVLLLQLEVPTAGVLEAIRIAREAGVRCIVDPGPVANDWTDKLLNVDFVCPNETEASAITGIDVKTIEDAETAAKQLQRRGAKNVAITLGERGVVLLMKNETHHIKATPVNAVDTTAAGDAFAGAVAVRWAETDDLLEAVRFANFAGALAAEQHGAQPSLATRKQIETRRKLS